jgi:hypothetical protein
VQVTERDASLPSMTLSSEAGEHAQQSRRVDVVVLDGDAGSQSSALDAGAPRCEP